MLKESMEFVINLPDESMVKALDYCGVRSIQKVNKWEDMGLHEGQSSVVDAPTIEEAPVSIECKVTQILPLGSHDMFLAEVVAVQVDDRYIDERGAFHMDEVGLVAYSHGDYMSLGDKLGSFGYSVRKKPLAKKKLSRSTRIKNTKIKTEIVSEKATEKRSNDNVTASSRKADSEAGHKSGSSGKKKFPTQSSGNKSSVSSTYSKKDFHRKGRRLSK